MSLTMREQLHPTSSSGFIWGLEYAILTSVDFCQSRKLRTRSGHKLFPGRSVILTIAAFVKEKKDSVIVTWPTALFSRNMPAQKLERNSTLANTSTEPGT